MAQHGHDARDDAATAPSDAFVLTLSCPDRPGIVHAVTTFLLEHDGDIRESQQFGDRQHGPVLHAHRLRGGRAGRGRAPAERVRAAVAERFDMTYELWAAQAPYRTLVLVSKQLHCLNDLLFRQSTGSLQIDIPAVVSNHPDAEPLAKSYGVPFHHVAGDARRPRRRPRPSCCGSSTTSGSTSSCWRGTCRSSPTGCAAGSTGG